MTQNQDLTQKAEAAYQNLLKVFPSAQQFFQPPGQKVSVDQALNEPLQAINRSERSIIFDKLRHINSQPITSIKQETLLYLEQQLSDIYGLVLSTESPLGNLPYLVGQIEAQAHLKSSPTDELLDHHTILEAGLRTQRSYFGWQSEKYGVALPLHELSQWHTITNQEKKHFAENLVLVINPVMEKALLAKIVDLGPHHTRRYQFGGTPQLIKDGGFWYPGCNGLAAIFFLDSSTANHKTGILIN